MQPRILVADDQPVARSGIQGVVLKIAPGSVIEEACTGPEALGKMRRNDYDLYVLDVEMPGAVPFNLVKEILHTKQKAAIVIISVVSTDVFAPRFMKMGVLSFISKNDPMTDLEKAISLALQGRKYLTPAVSDAILNQHSRSDTSSPFKLLSNTELDIIRRIIQGHSNSAISEDLHRSRATVSNHKRNAFEKLGITTLPQLQDLIKLYKPWGTHELR